MSIKKKTIPSDRDDRRGWFLKTDRGLTRSATRAIDLNVFHSSLTTHHSYGTCKLIQPCSGK
jgi:hypothetical protein